MIIIHCGLQFISKQQCCQFFFQFLKRQADDVAVRAGNLGDNFVAVLLNRVSARLVQRIHLCQIVADLSGRERTKCHIRADGKNPFAVRAQLHQANARDDLMHPALKARQHLFRLIKIARLAENFAPQKNQRVRAKHPEQPSIASLLVESGIWGLQVLPAGTQLDNPSELFGSPGMQPVLDQIQLLADVVLLDSPPVLAVPDTAILGSMARGAVIVA